MVLGREEEGMGGDCSRTYVCTVRTSSVKPYAWRAR